MPLRLHISFLLALFLIPLSGVSAEEETIATIENLAVFVDTVVNIDNDNRILTLRSKSAEDSTFTLGLEVQNIDKIQQGEQVIVHYFNAFATSLGPKRTEFSLLKTEKTIQSAQTDSRKTRSISTVGIVEAIDLKKRLVTVMGEEPIVVSVSDDFDLSGIVVGNEVELSYIEFYAVNVDPASKITGTVTINSTSVAAGFGYEWGEGVLTMYDGSTYTFDISGVSMVDVGISLVKAEGNIYRVIESTDIEGDYWVAEIGISYGDGLSGLTMKNSNGVILRLSTKLKGMKATLAAERLSIKNVMPKLDDSL